MNLSQTRTRLAALSAAGLISLAIVGFALASPPTVFMHAGGCDGQGDSWLSYPAGYTRTVQNCGSGYLSGTVAFTGGGGQNYPGFWTTNNQLFGNTGTGAPGPVGAAAATHALQYLTSFDGYYGTNTW